MKTDFVGRENELNTLKDLWEKAKSGHPQVFNCIADTGVGKTRLIQAFYEWLSTDPSQGDGVAQAGYWPDDLGTGRQRVVNPGLDRFKEFDLEHRAIPWLWWGMYWTDTVNDVRNALLESSLYLELHLELLEINRARDRSAIRTLLEVGADELVDNAVGAIGHAADVVGLGFVTKVPTLISALKRNIEKSREAKKGAGESQKKHVDGLSDELLLRLKQHFKKTKGAIPMVLFLDDVHFATDVSRDEVTLTFLSHLLHQAQVFGWPLLVIATHWKAPWQSHLQETVGDALPWRRLMTALETEHPNPEAAPPPNRGSPCFSQESGYRRVASGRALEPAGFECG